jgi:DNA ligase-1
VCQYFDRLEKESGRLVKVDILSELFRAVIACNAKDLITIIYLAVNQIAPAYTGLELGVGDMIIMKAISESTGSSTKKLKDDLETIGDLALVAESKKSTQKPIFPPPPLTAANVFETFKKIANSGAANVSIQP